MAASLQEILGYVPLTELVMKVKGGIPKVLPDAFWSLTRDVDGDRYRRMTFRGTRAVSKITPYGSPATRINRVSRGTQDMVLLHTIEQVQVNAELLNLFRQFNTYEPAQKMARDILQQDTEQFAQRLMNLEVAAIQASLAYGKLWFDADGNLQTSASGAATVIDYGVPSANTGDVGGIIGAPWSTASTDVVTQILNIKTKALQTTGYPLKYAFYGKNVAGNLAKNTSFQQYLARNPQYNQNFVNTGQIAPGTLDLTWVPVQDAFFEDENGTIQEIFPADQVTFYPEINSDVYQLMQGGYPVPEQFGAAPSAVDLLNGAFKYVYGVFKYANSMPGSLEIIMNQGHTFLPDHKVPAAMFIVDTTP